MAVDDKDLGYLIGVQTKEIDARRIPSEFNYQEIDFHRTELIQNPESSYLMLKAVTKLVGITYFLMRKEFHPV